MDSERSESDGSPEGRGERRAELPPDGAGELAWRRDPDGSVRLEVRAEDGAVWVTPQRLAELLGGERATVARHVRRALVEGEIDEGGNVHLAAGAEAHRPVVLYGLGAALAAGFRARSREGTHLRAWANGVLCKHLLGRSP